MLLQQAIALHKANRTKLLKLLEGEFRRGIERPVKAEAHRRRGAIIPGDLQDLDSILLGDRQAL